MTASNWVEWHEAYDDPDTPLSRRLATVQHRIGQVLDTAAPGTITVTSVCAGQGRDLIPVVARHPRRADVRALLVELDQSNVDAARAGAASAGLAGIEVLCADASTTDAYAGAPRADLLMLCGIFGNISDDDIHNTVRLAPVLCAPGAAVIWTRHRREPDLTPTVRSWFTESGFEEVAFDVPDGYVFTVGTVRFTGEPVAFRPSERLFTFTDRNLSRRPEP